MSQYQRREDLTIVPELLGLSPQEGNAFMAFHNSMEREDGLIPRKYRELIALGVAFTTQCAYCIDAHTRHAQAHGATRQEIAEAAFVAAAVKAGGTLAHSLMALRIFDEGQAKTENAA
ncbi:MAG: carboxymuconolactone decarboxylase family protein [bacterium]|nr:carboxymuconolactone decarboxylase family protein [bacterium]